MRIYIDADACPVKTETLRVAERFGIPVTLVSNGGIRPSRDPMVTTVVVADGPDVADNWIVDAMEAGDIVVTNDIPLASNVLDKNGRALKPNGKEFTEQSIGMALAMRDVSQHIRESTNSQTRHKPFTDRDRSDFLQALDRLIVKLGR